MTSAPLWAGAVRIWRVESPITFPAEHQSKIDTWVARAAALGLTDAAFTRPGRRTSAYLDLPGGPYPAAVAGPLPAWPDVTAADVPAAFRASANGFREVPIIRAERLDAIAMKAGDAIEVYDAGRPDMVIARVPAAAFPSESGG